MSYLRFKIVNTHATVPLALDYSAAGLIQSLAIYHGSNLLEQINEYNALYHLFLDLQGSTETVTRAGSILLGTHATNLRTGVTVAANNGEAYVCIPIMSGIVGPLQSKYLPTGVMTGGDLRLELTLASTEMGVVASAGSTWEVRDVEVELEYVEVSSEVDRMIQASNPRYVISFESFANYTNSITTSEGQINKLIPARFSSLKTLYTIFRRTADITSLPAASVTARVNPTIRNWSTRSAARTSPPPPSAKTSNPLPNS